MNETRKHPAFRFPILTFIFLMFAGSLIGIGASAGAVRAGNLGYLETIVVVLPFVLATFCVALPAAVLNHLVLGEEDHENATVGDFGIMVLGIMAMPLALSFVPSVSDDVASCMRVASLTAFGIMAGATVILITAGALMDRFFGTHPE